jgi:hypothetical protein
MSALANSAPRSGSVACAAPLMGLIHNGRIGDPGGSEAVPAIFLSGGLLLPVSNGPMPRHAENRLDFPSSKAYPGSRCGNGTSTAPSGPIHDAVSPDAASP